MTARLTLPPRLDTGAAEGLRADLCGLTEQDLSLDASAVEHLGALCLEVLLTVRHIWSSAGQNVAYGAPSPAFMADLTTYGVSIHDLSTGEAK